MPVPSEFSQWLNDSLQDGIMIDLIAVAAHDVLNFGYRTRRPSSKTLKKILLDEYRNLITKEQAKQFAESAGDWTKQFSQSNRREFHYELQDIAGSSSPVRQAGLREMAVPRLASDRPCCVSKIFSHISRRMACYWRENRDYQKIKSDLEDFAFAKNLRR